MTHPEIAIQAAGLSKTLGGRRVLERIDFELVGGEVAAFLGANGAGKTTLLRCLASVLRPNSGEVRWFGESARANPASRRLIGWVGHETCLYSQLTARENLIFAARMQDVREPARRADQLLQSVGLSSHAHRVPGRLSKGMRQRLSVVRSLVHDPPILLLDEPFTSLDAESTDWLADLVTDMRRRRRTVCFATHDMSKVERLADRTFHLRSGRLNESEVEACRPPASPLPDARAA